MLVACWGGEVASWSQKWDIHFGWDATWLMSLESPIHMSLQSFMSMSRLLSLTLLCCAWQLCSLSNLCLSVLENNLALFSVLQRFSRGRWQKHNGSPSYCLWSAYWVVIPSSLHSPHWSSNQEHICICCWKGHWMCVTESVCTSHNDNMKLGILYINSQHL